MRMDQKVLGHYGATDDIYMALWMLADGTLVNGTKEGNQRDYDHRDIEWLYPGQDGYTAVQLFMRHGAVRMGCGDGGILFEFVRPLSTAQKQRLGALARAVIFKQAETGSAPEFCAVRHTSRGEAVHENASGFAAYLANYCGYDVFGIRRPAPAGITGAADWAAGQIA